MNRMMQTDWISLSEKIYRALLILYPAEYRREYGSLMVQVFRDVCRDRYRRQGIAGMILWWCRTLLDLTLTAVEEWRKVRFVMSKSLFIQMSSIFLVLGGLFVAAASFSALQPDDHYTYYGIYQVLIWMLAPGFLLSGLGCIGLALRYRQVLGSVGRWALYATGLTLLLNAAGMVAVSINDDLWKIWLGAALMHVIALSAFGLLHLRAPFLPIFRALPLMMASGWWFALLGIPSRFPQNINNLLVFLMFLGFGLGWVAIGLRIQRQQGTTAPALA